MKLLWYKASKLSLNPLLYNNTHPFFLASRFDHVCDDPLHDLNVVVVPFKI
jgi:hypothetical protein